MGIIKLICKQCGGQMELDDSRDTAFCGFCGTKHLIKEEVINNTTIHNTTQNIVKNFHGNVSADYKDADELVTDGQTLMKLGQLDKAYEKFKKAISDDPKNANAWLGYAESSGASPDPDISKGSFTAFRTAYELSSAADRDAVLKIWMDKGHSRFEEIFTAVDEGHKESVLDRWTDDVEKANCGYEALYNRIRETHGDGRVNDVLIPRWTEQVRGKIAADSADVDVFQVGRVTSSLSAAEKESLIYMLLRKAHPRWNVKRSFEANVGIGWGGNETYFFAKKLCAENWPELSSDCKKNFDFTKEEIGQMNKLHGQPEEKKTIAGKLFGGGLFGKK